MTKIKLKVPLIACRLQTIQSWKRRKEIHVKAAATQGFEDRNNEQSLLTKRSWAHYKGIRWPMITSRNADLHPSLPNGGLKRKQTLHRTNWKKRLKLLHQKTIKTQNTKIWSKTKDLTYKYHHWPFARSMTLDQTPSRSYKKKPMEPYPEVPSLSAH